MQAINTLCSTGIDDEKEINIMETFQNEDPVIAQLSTTLKWQLNNQMTINGS